MSSVVTTALLVQSALTIAQGEVQFIEVYDSPNAMDVHSGNCFPYYITMLPHADMAELIAVVERTCSTRSR